MSELSLRDGGGEEFGHLGGILGRAASPLLQKEVSWGSDYDASWDQTGGGQNTLDWMWRQRAKIRLCLNGCLRDPAPDKGQMCGWRLTDHKSTS